MSRILSLYIIRQHVGPFFFGVFVITFILIMDLLIRYIDLFLGKGVPLGVVLEVFMLSLGWMVALIVPMAVLVASLMAFGRLSADNEITAMKAAGVSTWQILLPPVTVAVLIVGGLIYFNNEILPDSNHRLAGLIIDIHRKRPALALKAGAFNDFQGYTIRVGKMNEKDGTLESVTIQKKNPGKESETIVARYGSMEFTDGGASLTLHLRDGEIHGVNEKNPSRYHRMSFYTHTIRIEDIGSELVRSEKKNRGDRELSSADMLERIAGYRKEIEKFRKELFNDATKGVSDRLGILDWEGPRRREGERAPKEQITLRTYARDISTNSSDLSSITRRIRDKELQVNRYMVEVHKKYALPVACLVFVLIGTPLGVKAHRGGAGVGVGFSIILFVIYYLFLTGGEKLADRGHIEPAVSMWAANVLIGGLGLYLVWQTTRETTFIRFRRFGRRRSEEESP